MRVVMTLTIDEYHAVSIQNSNRVDMMDDDDGTNDPHSNSSGKNELDFKVAA